MTTSSRRLLTRRQLTAIQASNVLFRDDPSKRFHPMGARGKFFGLGKSYNRRFLC